MVLRILPATTKSNIILAMSGSSLVVCVLLFNAEIRYVLIPIVAALFFALLCWLTLSDRRGKIPMDDIGIITVLAIVCYTVIPPLQFWLSGMEYKSNSAVQLYALVPTSKEVGSFTWWYVIYLVSFGITYLWFDYKITPEEV